MSVIDIYFNTVPAKEKAELERIRRIVKKAVPSAEETISYDMPAFRYKNKYLVGFAVSKEHMSLHPTPEPIAELKDKLSKYKFAKGTIQFTLEKPLSETMITKIVRIRKRIIDGS